MSGPVPLRKSRSTVSREDSGASQPADRSVPAPAGVPRPDPSGYYAEEPQEVELLDYIEVLVKRRWLILGGSLACALAAGLFALSRPTVYRAEAVVTASRPPDFLALTTASRDEMGRDFYAELLESVPVRRAVLDADFTYTSDGQSRTGPLFRRLGVSSAQAGLEPLAGIVDVTSERSGTITIAARTDSPELSASVANEFIRQLIEYNRTRYQRQVLEQVAFAKGRAEELERELVAAETALTEFRRSNRNLLPGDSGTVPLSPELATEYNRLQREVDLRSSLLSTVLNQYEVARIEAQKALPAVDVLAYALPPENPEPRGLRKRLALGFIVGGMAFVMVAFLAEYVSRQREAGRLDAITADLGSDLRRLTGLFRRPPVV